MALAREERGTAAMIVALLLIPLMGMLALTIDVGYGYRQRRMAQNVGDSAAMAGAGVVAAKLLQASVTDQDVLNAIRDVARNSSGGFLDATVAATDSYNSAKDFFTAVYVADANGDGVPEDITPAVQVGSGTIPANARGVRVAPRRATATFFAGALGSRTLSAGATATALALDVVGFSDWAPYAIWGGEDEHVCYNTNYVVSSGPKVVTDSEGTHYAYGCIPLYGGSKDTPGGIKSSCWVPPGQQNKSSCKPTRVIYRSPSYQNRNVFNGDKPDSTYGYTRWQDNSSKFKGFFHTSNDWIDITHPIDYDTAGGVAEGSADADRLHDCWLKNEPNHSQNKCFMVMPVARRKTGTDQVALYVSSFALVKLITDPYSNANDWEADLVQAPLFERDVKVGPCPTDTTCLKAVRLVQ